MIDDKELLAQDLVLEYRINRDGGIAPQISLEGLWLPRDVQKMNKMVIRAVKGQKVELLRERKLAQTKPEEKKDDRKRKQK